MRIFDYIFYRVYGIFSKHESYAEISASAIVGLYQLLSVVSTILIASLLFDFKRPDYKFLIPVGIFFIVINWYRYERKFGISQFNENWKSETSEIKKIRGWLLVIYLVGIIAFPWIYGMLNN